jgi:hypothetical protein
VSWETRANMWRIGSGRWEQGSRKKSDKIDRSSCACRESRHWWGLDRDPLEIEPGAARGRGSFGVVARHLQGSSHARSSDVNRLASDEVA